MSSTASTTGTNAATSTTSSTWFGSWSFSGTAGASSTNTTTTAGGTAAAEECKTSESRPPPLALKKNQNRSNPNNNNNSNTNNNNNNTSTSTSPTPMTLEQQHAEDEIWHHLSVLALGDDYHIIQELQQQLKLPPKEEEKRQDLIVNTLLTQFPTYGQNSKGGGGGRNNHTSNTMELGSDPHAGFWLGPFARSHYHNNHTSTIRSVSSTLTTHNNKKGKIDDDGEDVLEEEDDLHAMLEQEGDEYSNMQGGGGGTIQRSNTNTSTGTSNTNANNNNNNNKMNNDKKSNETTTTPTAAGGPGEDWDEEEQTLWKVTTTSINNNNNTNSNSNTTNANSDHHHHHHHEGHLRTNSFLELKKQLLLQQQPDLENTNAMTATTTLIATQTTGRRRWTTATSANNSRRTNNNSNNNNQLMKHNEHWMPDQLCKHCYACETPFTVFRRRHHCRFCGQVFCNACSAFFVPTLSKPLSNSSATTTTTTTTTMMTSIPSSSTNTDSIIIIADAVMSANNSTTTNNNQNNNATTTTVRVCKMCFDQVSSRKKEGGVLYSPTSTMRKAAGSSSATNTTTTALDISSDASISETVLAKVAVVTAPVTQQQQQQHSKRSALIPANTKQKQQQQQQVVLPEDENAMKMMTHRRKSRSESSIPSPMQQQKQLQQQQQQQQQQQSTTKAKRNEFKFGISLSKDEGDLEDNTELEVNTDIDPRQFQDSEKYNDNNNTGSDNLHGDNVKISNSSSSPIIANGISNSFSFQNNTSVQEGNRQLGMTAALHLEAIAKELLRLHAPLLWNQLLAAKNSNYTNKASPTNTTTTTHWIDKLLTLATRCCATVNPNVKKGDLLDIRPYVKVKVIPGGSYKDCAYMSGVVFRKTVSHKKMAKEVSKPRIMLLSGGIEFTRTENRIASLETLFEQEDTYMEILVGKILKLQPDILLIGRSASRKAQELLLKAGVILIQHVKSNLLNRISRQTGATIISSTDHVMNQFDANVLGTCQRFRLVTFRDNEVWTDSFSNNDTIQKTTTTTTTTEESSASGIKNDTRGGQQHPQQPQQLQFTQKQKQKQPKVQQPKCIKTLLADPNLSNHERQAVLAASQLGEGVIDGSEAVRSGLAKRGVAQTYVMLEGCPKHLGCTVVLRGANQAALKQVKTVFRFLANVAYNLRLETSYLRERGARIRPDFHVIPEKHTFSSSLCVDYGQPLGGRKVRPWNGGGGSGGGNSDIVPRPESGEITAFDHQSILITSVWMTDKTQCCPAEVKGICYYSLQDVSLGQFLRDSCFNLSLKCQNPNCKKSVLDHSLSFVHNDGLINITVEEMDERLPPSPSEPALDSDEEGNSDDEDEEADRPIATWTFCQHCRRVVTPLVYISENTWKWSFGKFLEVFFYNRDAILNAPDFDCSCQLQTSATLYFGCGKLAARFTYEKVAPFGVFVRRNLPIDFAFHRQAAMRHLDVISVASSELFVKFDKHIDKVSREARYLFNSALNRPEHLQTVLSELNRIGSEVDHAAKTLQEKIASVTDSCRRNDDSTINGALFRFPWFARRYLFNLTSAWNEKLRYAGQALSAMKKIAASVIRNDGVGLGPNVAANVSDTYQEELTEGMKRLRQLIDHYAHVNVTDITQVLPTFPGAGDIQNEGEYDDEFDDPESTIDFADGVDADVLASRRRLRNSKQGNSHGERSKTPTQRPTKALGTRRSLTDLPRSTHSASQQPSSSHDSTVLGPTAPPKPTPGGAVKSAITRFFNRGGRDYEQYIVELGMFTEGRPRLPPGVNGVVVPVRDEQLSTIIAYSLSSVEYAKQFKHYLRSDTPVMDPENPSIIERTRKVKPDLDAGIESDDYGARAFDSRIDRGHGPMLPPPSSANKTAGLNDDFREHERRMLGRNKAHIAHTFRDIDEKGYVTCKFKCTTYWATQFHAVRQVFLSQSSIPSGKVDGESENELQSGQDVEQSYIESLSSAEFWAASGGKSGASFARTSDDRFVIKCISRTELQMFLDCAPAYFEYLSKAFFHGLPTALCKIVGVYQIGVHNRVTGKRSMEQVAVMQNIFYKRRITKVFDLKGSLRGRFAAQIQSNKDDSRPDTPVQNKQSDKRSEDGRSQTETPTDEEGGESKDSSKSGPAVLLDGDFLEFTMGRPMPLTDRAKAVFQMSILNDTLFLSIINVLDYSILIGVDEDSMELVVGIIDFMRQYDILKQMERVGKSLPMVVGSEAPTIIQPPLYKARFTNAMERYFMTVPSKWTTI